MSKIKFTCTCWRGFGKSLYFPHVNLTPKAVSKERMYFTEKEEKKKASFTPREKETSEITKGFLYSKRIGKLFGCLGGKPARKDRARSWQPRGLLGQANILCRMGASTTQSRVLVRKKVKDRATKGNVKVYIQMHTATALRILGKWGRKTDYAICHQLERLGEKRLPFERTLRGAFPSRRNMFHVIQTLSRFLSQKLLHYLGKHVNQRLQLAIYRNDARFNIQRARSRGK